MSPDYERLPTQFHSGTLGGGMRAAIVEIEGAYREMIEGWERP